MAMLGEFGSHSPDSVSAKLHQLARFHPESLRDVEQPHQARAPPTGFYPRQLPDADASYLGQIFEGQILCLSELPQMGPKRP